MFWLLTIVSLALLFLALAIRRRPSHAIGVSVVFAIAMPAWVQLQLYDVPDGTIVGAGVDAKVALGALALILYSFLPRASFPIRLVACDLAVISLMCIHCVSDFLNSGVSINVILRVYGEWYVPYLAGRLAVQSLEDLEDLWKPAALVSIGLGIIAVIEGFSGWNAFESIFGLRALEMTPRDAYRWGIRRAYGPCLNPIYFGVLQLLLMAWPIYAAMLALRGEAKSYWLAAPAPAMLGVVATASRGPILGLIILVVVCLVLTIPKARWPIVGAAILVFIGALTQRELILQKLEQWSGEGSRAQKQVVVDGELTVYSGTRSRLLMLEVYKIAFQRSGLLGFGTSRTTGFPVQVPLGEREVATLQRVKFVDNAYALLLLRFGYLGLAAFCCVCLLGGWQAFITAKNFVDDRVGDFSIALVSSLIAGLAVMMVVWMPHDYGFALLWTIGLTSGLRVSEHYGEL